MTLPAPTHIVTVQHSTSKTVHISQCFSLAYAEALLAAYRAQGWAGVIEKRSP